MIVDKALILRTLKARMNFRTNSDFARFLEIAPNVLSNWYKRNTFDEHIVVNKFPEISKSWILSGEGEMLKKNNPVAIDVSNMVSMPADVWEVIKNQAESLKSKDAQTSEVIEMLKEQMKKSYRAERQFRAASSVVVVEDE